jgi:hypothetical protein
MRLCRGCLRGMIVAEGCSIPLLSVQLMSDHRACRRSERPTDLRGGILRGRCCWLRLFEMNIQKIVRMEGRVRVAFLPKK